MREYLGRRLGGCAMIEILSHTYAAAMYVGQYLVPVLLYALGGGVVGCCVIFSVASVQRYARNKQHWVELVTAGVALGAAGTLSALIALFARDVGLGALRSYAQLYTSNYAAWTADRAPPTKLLVRTQVRRYKVLNYNPPTYAYVSLQDVVDGAQHLDLPLGKHCGGLTPALGSEYSLLINVYTLSNEPQPRREYMEFSNLRAAFCGVE